MCITHADWDLEISEQLKGKFDCIVKFDETLTPVKFSRCYFYDIMPCDDIASYELHGFSDDSIKAYECCLYLICVTSYKNKITISRHELLGNLISSFKGEIDISSLYVWSSSKVSLALIKWYNKEFATFVQN